MLTELADKFEGRSPSAGTPDVRIERCTNSYAQAFSPPSGGEQYFLQYLNGSWQVVAEGTGLACSDPDAGRPANYSTCRAEPRRSTLPRLSGNTRARALKLSPRPGILAKIPCGPSTIRPVLTSYFDPCQGHTRQPPSSMLPPARSARRWRHLRPTAK